MFFVPPLMLNVFRSEAGFDDNTGLVIMPVLTRPATAI
jgi:hypothetical protein